MTHTSLQAITWATVSAAVVSAMLLAAAGDEADDWRLEPPAAGPLHAPARTPAVRDERATPHAARPAGGRAAHDSASR